MSQRSARLGNGDPDKQRSLPSTHPSQIMRAVDSAAAQGDAGRLERALAEAEGLGVGPRARSRAKDKKQEVDRMLEQASQAAEEGSQEVSSVSRGSGVAGSTLRGGTRGTKSGGINVPAGL